MFCGCKYVGIAYFVNYTYKHFIQFDVFQMVYFKVYFLIVCSFFFNKEGQTLIGTIILLYVIINSAFLFS